MTATDPKPPRKPRRSEPAEPASMMIRIPTALKPVVVEMNRVYREAKSSRIRLVTKKPSEDTTEQ